MKSEYAFTVFTPTYNRAHTLHRVYESLRAQTCREFEWLIVDDGSSDQTRELVEIWRRGTSFPIRYLYQENQGKHIAFNNAVSEARGEWFLPIDSDDSCAPAALERFWGHWQDLAGSRFDGFCAVTVLAEDQTGKIIGDRFPSDVLESNFLEIRYRHKVRGDKWNCFRVAVLKQYPFPSVPGSQFVPEGIVWSKLARRYKTLFVNEVLLTVYRQEDTDNSDQLTSRRNPGKHAKGIVLWHRSVLNTDLKWFAAAPAEFARSAIHYSRFSLHAGISVIEQLQVLCGAAKCLCMIFLPIGAAIYAVDKRRLRRVEKLACGDPR